MGFANACGTSMNQILKLSRLQLGDVTYASVAPLPCPKVRHGSTVKENPAADYLARDGERAGGLW